MVERVRSEREIIECPSVFIFCNSKLFELLAVIFKKKKTVPQTVVGYEFTRLSRMQHNLLFFFAYLNFELSSLNDQWTKVAAMRRKRCCIFQNICIEVYGK